ncbi:RNA polymerase sigma factor [Pedobacter sp.]|jgi:RNA polymerase sigma-70 factor (family 1)|uniref:RNA polymerase sigma factor n=1 Tax=Pedobacter sp. TaxID=1411316 RepID=UPI002C3AF568|nr:RNA polymerase sigma factor [Pedobacter sp.]HWW39404.1 RNA polymerase sigma factor [Pedobacter sp.]
MTEKVFSGEERELLEEIALGNRKAFARLYTFYVPKLQRFLYPFTNQNKEDADEVIQDVFLKIWMKKEILIGIKSFEAYLFRMARNRLTDQRVSDQARKVRTDGLLYISNTVSAPADEELFYKEYLKSAKDAIQALSPQRKKIFEMRTEQDLNINEIAAQLGISQSAVKKQLYEAIHTIKEHLNHQTGWPMLLVFMTILS